MAIDWNSISNRALAGEKINDEILLNLLDKPGGDLLALVNAAYQIRQRYFGNEVFIHILNNIQNGSCPEDCHYCAQSKKSDTAIEEYSLKSDAEVLAEAKEAYERGAFRYCLVFAGRTPSLDRIKKLAGLVGEIKKRYNLQICVSPGILDEGKAQILKAAGVDRINHNLNTSNRHYSKICTTHGYADRLATLKVAKKNGLAVCSGMIVGMGEETADIIEVAKALREIKAESIPINFYLPIEGTRLAIPEHLTPEYCLRVLCLFRLLNPEADIRIAAGREYYLKSLEVLALYPASSLFLEGYLNVKGTTSGRTLQMIKDAGFAIRSDQDLQELIAREQTPASTATSSCNAIELKNWNDLHPKSL